MDGAGRETCSGLYSALADGERHPMVLVVTETEATLYVDGRLLLAETDGEDE